MKIRATALLAGVALLVVAFAGTAQAHTKAISSACAGVNAGLHVQLTDYNGTNHVTIVFDGTTVTDVDFGASRDQVVANPDPTVAHSWTVTVVAHDDPTGSHGWSFTSSGTIEACQETPTTQPPVTTTPPPITLGPSVPPVVAQARPAAPVAVVPVFTG